MFLSWKTSRYLSCVFNFYNHGDLIIPYQFGVGDGFLNFYLYNWRTAKLAGMNNEGSVPAGKGVGIVML